MLATERKDARWALAADVMQPAAAVQSEDDLRKVTELIVTHGLREIPVVDGENHVIGLLNERDVARVHLKGLRRRRPGHAASGAAGRSSP